MKLFEYGLTQYDLSKILNISEISVYRKLREELSETEQDEIIKKIEQSRGEHALTEQTGGDLDE